MISRCPDLEDKAVQSSCYANEGNESSVIIMCPWWALILFVALVRASALEKLPHYNWEEYTGLWSQTGGHSENRNGDGSLIATASRLGTKLAQDVVGKPVYMSMTTMSSRLYGIGDTIDSLLEGERLPNQVFIFISVEPHLLDKGISKEFLASDSTSKLRELYERYPHISIVYVDNIGPHRKLLPLLSAKWDEDCLLVTIDDHEVYPSNMLSSLLDYYVDSGGSSVVARRARRMGICAATPPWTLCPYTNARKRGLWPETKPARYEMLMLPTGTGGVLYRPAFFHPLVFDEVMWEATKTGDDLMFRLSTMAKGIPVVTTCCQDQGLRAACPTRSTSRRIISKNKELMKEEIFHVWGQEYIDSQFIERSHDLTLKRASVDKSNINDEVERKTLKGERARAREIRKKRRGQYKNYLEKMSANSTIDYDSNRQGDLLIRRLRRRNARSKRRSDRKRQFLLSGRDVLDSDRRLDDRKVLSLATKFNNDGGNNAMWARATQYLKEEGILDFNLVLSQFASYERAQCLITSSILGPSRGARQDFLGGLRNWWDVLLVYVQNNLWDAECGVHICAPT